MKIINIHQRIIHQPKSKMNELFRTLATDQDKMLATELWPRMRLDKGLAIGSKGGHGPIGYEVVDFIPDEFIKFVFTKPKGFNGFHQFEMREVDSASTELKHTIDMEIKGLTILQWNLVVRHIHDNFMEDALDQIENQFSTIKKLPKWSRWVKFLRMVLPKE